MTYETSGRTLSAMFDTRTEADAAAESLRAIGATDIVLHGEKNEGYVAEPRDRDRGFFESLGDFFFPDEDRAAYAEGLNRGGYLVTATNVPDHLVDQASSILDNEGAVDLDAREGEWRNDGWTTDDWLDPARDDQSRVVARDVARRDGGLDADDKIEVIEERLNIGKRDVERGNVRVRSYVREEPVSQDVELTEERIDIERRPVDRAATDADFQDRSIEAHAYAEEAVVNKEARVVEEIALTKTRDSHVETVSDTVRKTEVEIDQDGNQIDEDGQLIR